MRKFLIVLAGGAALLPAPLLTSAAAAQSGVEGRVGKLESEMRAVQRKVFQGGDATLLQPEIAQPSSRAEAPGTPATSAVADLSQRVTSLEQQMSTLTGQIEQNQYKLRTLQEAFDAYKRSNDSRIRSLETSGAPVMSPVASSDDTPAPRPTRAATTKPETIRPTPSKANETATTPAPTGGARARLVAAVEKPATGDGAEDGYLYGYRLWQAKLYPEAQAQLKKVVADYPKSPRASYAQNLLGRAYLDEGKPSLASMAFYDNYKKMPDGERAPDSLLYLGSALMKLNKPADACKVYGELDDVYGAKLSAAMKADVAKGRAAAKCS